MLHGVATGMAQLHQAGIEHTDLKPSNILEFDEMAKVGDLGRSSASGGGMFDNMAYSGDPSYAPFEVIYGTPDADGTIRRRACDIFQLGSLAMFMFTGVNLTGLVCSKLDPAFHASTWPKNYTNALPYITEAFEEAVEEASPEFPEGQGSKLAAVIRELSDPDPMKRGNPSIASRPLRYSMQRYVSRFDNFAKSAEIALRNSL